MRIGILGGSFNPPHIGHRHISLVALKRLALDRIWWVVSPGNPLKSHDELASLADRMDLCRAIADHPRIEITDFEKSLGSSYTFETLGYIRQRYPETDFVWLMGADNLISFHHWMKWKNIAELIPLAVIDRPGFRYHALRSRFAFFYNFAFVSEEKSPLLTKFSPPVWTFISSKLCNISSTNIRNSSKIII